MEKGKATKRALQSIETRKKIYDVSIELIRERGFDGVTIENISKKAGVSVGAFYHYFDSKADVMYEIFKQIDEYFEKEVAGRLQGTPCEKIDAYFGYYAEFIIGQGLEFIQQLYTTKNKLFIKKDRFLWTCLKGLIEEGQRSHEITAAVDSEEIMDFVFIFVRGVVFDWCLHDGSYDLRETLLKDVKRILTIFEA